MASAYALLLLLLFMIFEVNVSQQSSIELGSSLSPSNEPASWPSPSRRFSFGFYRQGSGFRVGIWLFTTPNITVVWTANRDDPPVSSLATLKFTVEGLILTRDQSKGKVIANGFHSASTASMLDSGEFVLYSSYSHVIWSSFKYPTDTILANQSLNAGSQLFSSVSDTNSSTGRFRLKMQEDGNLVWYLTNTIDDEIESYDSENGEYDDGKLHLYLNNTGDLVILNSSMSIIDTLDFDEAFDNSSVVYRATLNHDGIFRLYSHCRVMEGGYNTSTKWQRPRDVCHVWTFCGLNSYCTWDDDKPKCCCLPGTDVVDPKQMSGGCQRYFIDQSCKSMNSNTNHNLYNMTLMEKMTWDDFPYYEALMEEEDCKKSCLGDCNCDAVLYGGSSCSKYKLPLKSARRYQEESGFYRYSRYSKRVAYFKTGFKNITSDNAADLSDRSLTIILILVMTIGLVTCSCVFLGISGFFIFKYRVSKYKWLLRTGQFGLTDDLSLRSFSYSELKKATKGFKEELGRGSFGAVYKGNFQKGKKIVAVKRLEKLMNDSSERQFHAEMHIIGRTHHKNLVRLLGYCAEDSKRLLVYEYMSNGSLADLLFHCERFPDWNERVRIALDVARGILYLHDECEAPIIHCDIKPQNILMDDLWTAKISDFGLAKLLMPDQTKTFTLIRGTRGYMAPEWSRSTPISVKADVYSYGVVLMEIVCCRRNMDVNALKPEEIVLTNWVYKCFANKELNKLVRDQDADKKTLESLVKVGLWCVQDEPTLRPSMKSVVMMLEGIFTDISIPPCPTGSSG